MNKYLLTSLIGLAFTIISSISWYMFSTMQENKIDSVIQRQEIKSLNENINRFITSHEKQTHNINKRIDNITDTLSYHQNANFKEHIYLRRKTQEVIYYLKITDKKFKDLFKDLADS